MWGGGRTRATWPADPGATISRMQPPRSALGAAALVLALAGPQATAGPLSDVEQRLVRNVDERNAEALALLERTVRIDSGTLDLAGVREVGAIFQTELDRLGFSTRWIDGASVGRAGTLVAEHRGEGPHLLLIGHLDTVFEKDGPFHGFEPLPGERARGPGVIDMKGGDVILIYALDALDRAGLLEGASLTVVLSGDEENPGRPLSASRRALREAAERADVALGFEDADGRIETAVIARRGTQSWQLRVVGTASHSSQIFQPEVGAGAIYESARILHEFYRRLGGERYLTFNPGVILGGTAVDFDAEGSRGTASGKSNVVAESTVVRGDLRAVSPEQFESAQRRMQEIVRSSLPRASAELTFEEGYPPMAPTAGTRRLLALFDQVSRDLGFGPVTAVDPQDAGAADVSLRCRARRDGARWAGAQGPGRPHRRGDGRPEDAPGADQAGRGAAAPAAAAVRAADLC